MHYCLLLLLVLSFLSSDTLAFIWTSFFSWYRNSTRGLSLKSAVWQLDIVITQGILHMFALRTCLSQLTRNIHPELRVAAEAAQYPIKNHIKAIIYISFIFLVNGCRQVDCYLKIKIIYIWNDWIIVNYVIQALA